MATDSTTENGVCITATAVSGKKEKDGSYIPSTVPPEWETEQLALSSKVLQTTSHLTFSPHTPFTGLKYIAGVDISFIKNTNKACAMLAILNFPDLTLAYKTYDIVEMTEPYIPFFLAFREVGHLVKLFQRVKVEKPEMYPQIVFVDGAGVWHPKGLGLASHLGVLLNIPTIGVAKNLLYMSDIPSNLTYDSLRTHLTSESPTYKVVGESGRVYGAAVIPRKAKDVEKPIFVSVGHLVDLDTAVELVHETSKFRIPEAIRAADGGSREVLRVLEQKHKDKGKA